MRSPRFLPACVLAIWCLGGLAGEPAIEGSAMLASLSEPALRARFVIGRSTRSDVAGVLGEAGLTRFCEYKGNLQEYSALEEALKIPREMLESSPQLWKYHALERQFERRWLSERERRIYRLASFSFDARGVLSELQLHTDDSGFQSPGFSFKTY